MHNRFVLLCDSPMSWGFATTNGCTRHTGTIVHRGRAPTHPAALPLFLATTCTYAVASHDIHIYIYTRRQHTSIQLLHVLYLVRTRSATGFSSHQAPHSSSAARSTRPGSIAGTTSRGYKWLVVPVDLFG